MNSWFKTGIPLVIAVLLVIATVGITLVVAGNSASQAASASYGPAKAADVQYARGPSGPCCLGYGQGTADPDDSQGDVYIPGGAKCPACPGYGQGAATAPGRPGTGTTTYRGGCCGRY